MMNQPEAMMHVKQVFDGHHWFVQLKKTVGDLSIPPKLN